MESEPSRKRHRGATSKLRRSKRHSGAECRRRHQRRRNKRRRHPSPPPSPSPPLSPSLRPPLERRRYPSPPPSPSPPLSPSPRQRRHHPSPPPSPRPILGLDAEFVNLYDGRCNKKNRFSGQNRVGHLAIVTVNDNADGPYTVLYNKVIKHTLQDGQWVDCATNRSGITEADYHNDIPYEEAIEEIKGILKDAIVVGHNIRCDFRALQLSMYPTVHCVYDTATNKSLNDLVPSERGKPQSKLAGLALSLLGETIQRHTVHDPVEDALASLRIYLKHKDLRWEPLGDPQSLATLQDGRTFRLA